MLVMGKELGMEWSLVRIFMVESDEREKILKVIEFFVVFF